MEPTSHDPSTLASTPQPPPIPPLDQRLARQAETEALGEKIAELAARISAATYQLLVLIREFDEREGWATGFRSCAHWLSWRTGLGLGPAREKVRVARALAELPAISSAMASGELSYSKARALTRVATADNEQELLDFAHHATASQVERFVRAWRQFDRTAEAERDELRRASRCLELHTDETGMVVVRGRLEPEVGAVLAKALDAAMELLYRTKRRGGGWGRKPGSGPGRQPTADASADGGLDRQAQVPEPDPSSSGGAGEASTIEQRRADAIGLVAEAALGSGLGDDTELDVRADRYQVVVHVDQPVRADPEAPGVSEVEGAGDVSAGTSRRLACDAATVTMTHDDDGGILDVGRKTRVISAALRRALRHRDRTCRFPGCDLTYCDAHHIHHWAAGGETKLQNLVLLCRFHHRCVHERGYRVETDPDGVLVFRRPDGRVIQDVPIPPGPEGDPSEGLAERLAEAGVDVEALDHDPRWDGSRLDLGLAIDELWRARGREEGSVDGPTRM